MTIQRYKAGIGGDKTVWPIVVPDVKGSLVYFADHERAVAGLCEQNESYRRVIRNLIAGMCQRCAKGDPLQIEPSTGHYTHTLGGNFCSASLIHHELADALLAEHAETKGE